MINKRTIILIGVGFINGSIISLLCSYFNVPYYMMMIFVILFGAWTGYNWDYIYKKYFIEEKE